MRNSVIHLVDDNSFGGVSRLLENLEQSSNGPATDSHKIQFVKRGQTKSPKIQADVIVSHMSACWTNLQFFTSLRASHPETAIVHVEHSYSQRFVALNVTNGPRFDDLLRITYSLFDKVVAVSVTQAVWLLRRRHCLAEQLVTIPSCVKLKSFFDVRDIRPQGILTVGAIGRLHEQKGFDILVKAFSKLGPQNIQLCLIGDGPEKVGLMELANGNPRIIFSGVTNSVAEKVAECHVIAMPSRWEPYGLVALEAMAANRPVICSNVDGLLDHIANGAFAVPQNTVEGWVSVLETLNMDCIAMKFSRSTDVAAVEDNFIKAWNTLTQQLAHKENGNQKAA